MSVTFAENSRGPSEPRPASTVVLVREQGRALQVYLLRRNPRSSFFPGNYVFPGGAVSALDREMGLWRGRTDIPEEEIARRLGWNQALEETLAYGVSAIRETFEEAGAFLGVHGGDGGEGFEKACRLRISTGLPKGWLKEWVEGDSCVLGFSRLARWSHWITPEAMPKRFDTRFFVAFLSPEQACSPDQQETIHGVWVSPEKALAGNLRGEIPLSPPTLVTLNEMLCCASPAELKGVLENRSWGKPIVPVLKRVSPGAVIVEPWDPMYGKEFDMDGSSLERAVVPVGEPFSRIWLHDGVWRPVRVE